jgi:hypothetical protein
MQPGVNFRVTDKNRLVVVKNVKRLAIRLRLAGAQETSLGDQA